MKHAAFTLTEIMIAVAIIATAMIAVLGLLPAGLNASRDAADSTVVATILEAVNHRLEGQPLIVGRPAISPAYFDDQGTFITQKEDDPHALLHAIYRADLEVIDWQDRPANTSSIQPVKVSLSWPVSPITGEAVGVGNPKKIVTYNITTLTGPSWRAVDPKFVPKIEF